MPYKSNNDLPDAVKNALPDKAAQDVFRNAFNSAYAGVAEGDEERALQIAWAAVKNAGYRKGDDGTWEKQADFAGHEGDPGVKKDNNRDTFTFDAEIFSAGTWNGDEYTTEDLDTIIESFYTLQDEIKPPIKLGHDESKWKDGLPAIGWVKDLRRMGSKLIATFKDVPQMLYEAIKKRRYKRVSSEIFFNYKSGGQTFKKALAAVAFLGSDMPAVKDLADLDAYLTQDPDAGTFELMRGYSLDVDAEAQIIINTDDGGDDMSEDIKKYQDENATLRTQNEKLAQELKEFRDSEAKRLEREAKERKESQETAIKAFCEDMVEKGILTPAARDIISNDMSKHVYTESDGYSISVETFKEFIAAQEKALDTDEKGLDLDDKKPNRIVDVDDELDKKTSEYMQKHDIKSYTEAQTAVLESDPDLAQRYKKAAVSA